MRIRLHLFVLYLIFIGSTAQWHNGAMAQATFAKATVAKGRKGTMAQWHIGKKFLN